MSNFTPLVVKKYDFEGDSITVTFARLKRKHMLELMPLVQKLSAIKEDAALKQAAITDLLNVALDFLPDYVKSIVGLVDSQGAEMDIDVVADEIYFVNLATDIVMDVLNESMAMDGKTGKNG